jgi:hypothetical protein
MARTRFHALLAAKLEEVIVNRSEELTSGCCSKYEEYKYLVGYLNAMRDALKICDEVNENEFGHSS